MGKVLLIVMLTIFLALLIVAGLAALAEWQDKRRKVQAEAQAKAAVKQLQHNPDAAWLYAQGLSPEQIELAVQQRVNVL